MTARKKKTASAGTDAAERKRTSEKQQQPDSAPSDKTAQGVRYFHDYAPTMHANGYRPVPVLPRDKRITVTGWQNFVFVPAHADQYADHSIGILTATTPAIDIDIRRRPLAQKLEKLAREICGAENAPRRVGNPPKLALLMRSESPFAKLQTRGYRFDGDPIEAKQQKVEILGNGQQLVAGGIHPDTGKPYLWNGAGSPLTVKADDLPLLTVESARAFIAAAEKTIEAAGGRPCGRLRKQDSEREHEPNERLTARNIDECLAAIGAMPNEDVDYDDWVYFGLAIKGALGNGGANAFNKWSRKSNKFNESETEKAWQSFDPQRIGAGTVLHLARAAGWKTEPDSSEVKIMDGDKMQIEPVQWVWKGHLARGKLHLIAGPPGTNKTTVAVALAATMTQGGVWPDGTRADCADVLFWTGEDGIEDTLLPRFEAHGADLSRVHFVKGVRDRDAKRLRAFDPATDMESLALAAARIDGLGMVVIDPVVLTVAGDSHKGAEVRKGLAPLVQLAEITNSVAVGITHFSKNTAGRHPLERVTGSHAFGAAARVVFACVKTEGNDRILVRAKSNLGPDGGGFAFTVVPVTVKECETIELRWGALLHGEAREIIGAAEAVGAAADDKRQDEPVDWLRALIEGAGGKMARVEILKAADDEGFSRNTIERARLRGRFRTERTGFPATATWCLPLARVRLAEAQRAGEKF